MTTAQGADYSVPEIHFSEVMNINSSLAMRPRVIHRGNNTGVDLFSGEHVEIAPKLDEMYKLKRAHPTH